jgi:hypothetical protein
VDNTVRVVRVAKVNMGKVVNTVKIFKVVREDNMGKVMDKAVKVVNTAKIFKVDNTVKEDNMVNNQIKNVAKDIH